MSGLHILMPKSKNKAVKAPPASKVAFDPEDVIVITDKTIKEKATDDGTVFRDENNGKKKKKVWTTEERIALARRGIDVDKLEVN